MAPPRKQRPASTGRLMKQAAAARTLGIARSTVMHRAALGELELEVVDGTPMIVRASVDAYLARRDAAMTTAA